MEVVAIEEARYYQDNMRNVIIMMFRGIGEGPHASCCLR